MLCFSYARVYRVTMCITIPNLEGGFTNKISLWYIHTIPYLYSVAISFQRTKLILYMAMTWTGILINGEIFLSLFGWKSKPASHLLL